MSIDAEVDRLIAWLDQPELSPGMVLAELPGFPPEVRGALLRRLAASGQAPPLRVLGRLAFLHSEANEGDLVAAYLAAARSPDAEARRISLYALDSLALPAAQQAALGALDDEADAVVAAASDILARRFADPQQVRTALQGVHDAHRGDPRFGQTLAILQAHGIGDTSPTEPA
jgi:hypothetical protein